MVRISRDDALWLMRGRRLGTFLCWCGRVALRLARGKVTAPAPQAESEGHGIAATARGVRARRLPRIGRGLATPRSDAETPAVRGEPEYPPVMPPTETAAPHTGPSRQHH